MATATAPDIRSTTRIIDTIERDGERQHRYRWTVSGIGGDGQPVDPTSGEQFAYEPLHPISRDIMQDRWNGYLRESNGDSGKRLHRMWSMLQDIAVAVARRDLDDEVVIDGEIVGMDVAIDVDGLEDVIRDWIFERAAKVGRGTLA